MEVIAVQDSGKSSRHNGFGTPPSRPKRRTDSSTSSVAIRTGIHNAADGCATLPQVSSSRRRVLRKTRHRLRRYTINETRTDQTQANSDPDPSRDFPAIIPPYRDSSGDAPELANFTQLMNRAHAETARSKSRDAADGTAELGRALDALSASFDDVDTTLKGMPRTALTPGVWFQWSKATQALRKAVYVNWAREDRDLRRLQAEEGSRPKPFPARLPSGRGVGVSGLALR